MGALILMLFVPFTISFTQSSSFCSSCHELKPQIESWKRSSHANIDCNVCHGAPNVFSLALSKLENVKNIVKHYTNQYDDPINLDSKLSQDSIPNERCLRCHSVVQRVVSPKSGFSKKMFGKGQSKYHAKHLKKGIQCVTCHNRVAHRGAEDFFTKPELKKAKGRTYQDNVQMEGCVRCHPVNEARATLAKKFPGAPKDCKNCHEKEKAGQMPEFHLAAGARWLEPSSLPGLGKGLSKERAVHSQEALKRGKAFCFTCHDWKTFCNKCHSNVFMPHEMTTWRGGKNLHEKVGRQDPQKCERCHKPSKVLGEQPVCVACHHKKWIDPSKVRWRNVHFNFVKKEGAVYCVKCHQLSFCIKCHSTKTREELGIP